MTKEARHLERCPICREAGPLADHLRDLPTPALTTSERERLWQGIRVGIEIKRPWRLPAILTWLRGFGRRRPTLAWVPVAVAAGLLVFLPLRVGREERVLSQAELNARTTVEHVETGLATSVLILQTATERLSVIWVQEPRKDGDAMHTPRG